MKDRSDYIKLAEMFRYPSAGQKDYSESWNNIISGYDPGLIGKLTPFTDLLNQGSLPYLEEYYVRTFDVQAVSSLDVGYVLFGDDYKRGVFLVNIKKEQLKAMNDCGSELPDHLPNIMTLLPKMQDAELADELVGLLLIPAIHEMILRFRNSENVYKGLLEILEKIMEADYQSSARKS